MTRFGLNLGGSEVEAIGSPKLTGRIEVDFYGGPASDSRNMFRMRHAWAKLQWGNFFLLARTDLRPNFTPLPVCER